MPNSSSAAIPIDSASREPISILEGMFSLAAKHHRQKRLPEAEQLYRRILAINPRHAAGLHGLGSLAQQVGRPEIAIQLFRTAIANDDANALYALSLGRVLESLGKLGEAAAVYTQALDRDPDCIEARASLQSILPSQAQSRKTQGSPAPFESANPQISA